MYDTCITLGNKGVPWCSIRTDENHNHLGNAYKRPCTEACKVNDCPIRFYRDYMDPTCYSVSKCGAIPDL